MSSIVGIVNGNSSERTVRTLDALLDQCTPRSGEAVEAVVSGEIALAVTDPSPGPWHTESHADRGSILAVCGRLFEKGLADSQGRPYPRELLARFCSRGVAGLQGLNGDYLIAVWEKGPRRLTIVNDRLGLRRLYYWVSGDRLAFTPLLTAFTALPGFPLTVDECALADYLATGHHFDGRTWYSAVQLLLPASVLTFSNGHLSLRNYWQLGQGDSFTRHSTGDQIERLLASVEVAISRRLPPSEERVKVWGDDSNPSSILLNLLQRGGRRVETIGGPQEMPCLINLGREASTAGIAEHGLPCRGAQLVSVGEALRRDGGTVFTSHPIQLLSPHRRAPRDLAGSHPDQLISMLCRPLLLDEEIRQILRPEVYRLVQGVTADSVARAYAKAPGDSIGTKALAVLLRQHQQHVTPFDLERHAGDCRIAAPFSDSAVLESLSALAANEDEEKAGPEGLSSVPGMTTSPSPAARAVWPTDRILGPAQEALGMFFRLPELRALLRRQAAASQKTCAIAGVCLSLAALANNPRTWHEPELIN